MPRLELDPYYLLQIANKLRGIVDTIDPEDPVYKGAFEGVAESLRGEWTAAIKDGAALVGLDVKSYGQELVRIAVENGLAPAGTSRLPKDLYSELYNRVSTFRQAIFAHEGFGSSPTHSLHTQITVPYGKKR